MGAEAPAVAFAPMLAAAPAWFADNVALIAAVTLLVLTALVLRMIQKTAARAILLALIALVAVLVWANRTSLERCARTCECDIAGQHLTVPACDPDVL